MPTSSNNSCTIRQEVESVITEAVERVQPILLTDDDEDARADIDDAADALIELIVAARATQEAQ